MSFIKASANGGEYERDVNATDAALDKGGNRKDLFSVYITYIFVFMSFNYEFVCDCICQAIVNYCFDAVNWGVTVAQISSIACQKREREKIRMHSNKSRNHDKSFLKDAMSP